jgi:thioester reductase-like protein
MLSTHIGIIFHNAAHVNGFLSYKQLKNDNVDATLRLLRFSVTASQKEFHFISSIGVFNTRVAIQNALLFDEQFDLSKLEPNHLTGYRYIVQ